jgi:hypothetical protein
MSSSLLAPSHEFPEAAASAERRALVWSRRIASWFGCRGRSDGSQRMGRRANRVRRTWGNRASHLGEARECSVVALLQLAQCAGRSVQDRPVSHQYHVQYR